MAEKQHRESLVDYAQGEIQRRIQNGTYLPGTKLSTIELAASLGISRTPVVAAINRLVAQGLAEATPHRGTVVTQLSLPQIREIIEVREMIELYSVDLILKNIDFCPDIVASIHAVLQEFTELDGSDYTRACELETKFHNTYVSLSCNSRLIRFYESNWSIGIVFLLFAWSKMPLYRFQESIAQHREIIERSKKGDAAGVRTVLRKHLQIVNDTLDWLVKNGGNDAFKPY